MTNLNNNNNNPHNTSVVNNLSYSSKRGRSCHKSILIWRNFSLYFVLFLLISSATAARKTKRPVKPAKTYPRTNITPAASSLAGGLSTVTTAGIAAGLTQGSSTSSSLPGGSSTTTMPSSSPLTLTAATNGALGSVATGQSITGSHQSPNQEPNELGHPFKSASGDNNALPKPMEAAGNGGDAGSVAAELKTDKQFSHMETASAGSGGILEEECDPDMIGFEIITGYVLSAPSHLLDTLPGTLMLTDCLEACQINESCSAVNYETGLCVLFKTTADKTPGSLSRSQFPVFTIHAQKSCLGVRPCSKAWCIDRVQGYRLVDHVKTAQTVFSRRDCLELCLGETEFTCRSANYYRHSGLCELSEMDRITLSGSVSVEPYDGADYLENNCAEEPSKLCEFKRISGKILKTVDSVYQDISSIEECRDLCLNSPYRCHSYDYNDTGDMVCRLSHHSRATLTDVMDPYLDVPEAATYELSSCYNVSIECKSGEMITKIRTSKLFDGKVYAKGAPKSCSVNVDNALEFAFRMGYNNLECNVRQSAYGRYMNDIVIQHHDMIVTSSDLGLAVSCQYDLTNKTVSNDVDLGVTGEIESSLSEEIIIDSPNVVMKITSRDGSDMKRIAEVGDPLALRFEIVDPSSPYEIFVRELVAMDGADNAEITLIDANGCPTDQYIMGSVQKASDSRKILISQFDAFKFPSSEVVQFRALVTPCIPRCEPIICNSEPDAGLSSGETKSLISYGRRKRSLNDATQLLTSHNLYRKDEDRQKRDLSQKPSDDNILLVQSIQITDKFGFSQDDQKPSNSSENTEKIYTTSFHDDTYSFTCLNGYGLMIAGALFLLVQLVVIVTWNIVQKRAGKERYLYGPDSAPSSINYGGTTSTFMYGRSGQSPGNSVSNNASGSSGGQHHHHHQHNHNHSGVSPLHHSGSSNLSVNDTLSKLYDSGINGRYGQQQY